MYTPTGKFTKYGFSISFCPKSQLEGVFDPKTNVSYSISTWDKICLERIKNKGPEFLEMLKEILNEKISEELKLRIRNLIQ